MITVKKLDVKGLEHGEREKLIFPLVHMLEARNEFEVSYEKEWPGEWILNITRTGESVDRKSRFKELLRDLKDTQISAHAKEHAKELFQAVDAKTIGILERELIREGVTQEEIRASLCDIHLEVLRDSLVAKRIEVSSPHPVHTLMEEHKVILENLNKLGCLVERIQTKDSFESVGEEPDEFDELEAREKKLIKKF